MFGKKVDSEDDIIQSEVMDLEIINRLYLELSQVATAKTRRELELEDLLASARAIVLRRGEDTAWERFDARLAAAGISPVTAKVFKVLPSDLEDGRAGGPGGHTNAGHC